MASYLKKRLMAGEDIIYIGRVSLWSLWGHISLGILLLPVGIGLIFLTIALIKYKSTELVITTKRLVAKFGFIARKTTEMNLLKIETVQVEQGVIGRIFNFGSLVISGAGTPQAPIPAISDPMTFHKNFVETQDKILKEQPQNQRSEL